MKSSLWHKFIIQSGINHATYQNLSVIFFYSFEFIEVKSIPFSPITSYYSYLLVPYCSILMYIYYHGIIDHSGITFKKKWWQPWQPDCIFHDNHHQYFHVNFAFNIEYWDKVSNHFHTKFELLLHKARIKGFVTEKMLKNFVA